MESFLLSVSRGPQDIVFFFPESSGNTGCPKHVQSSAANMYLLCPRLLWVSEHLFHAKQCMLAEHLPRCSSCLSWSLWANGYAVWERVSGSSRSSHESLRNTNGSNTGRRKSLEDTMPTGKSRVFSEAPVHWVRPGGQLSPTVGGGGGKDGLRGPSGVVAQTFRATHPPPRPGGHRTPDTWLLLQPTHLSCFSPSRALGSPTSEGGLRKHGNPGLPNSTCRF